MKFVLSLLFAILSAMCFFLAWTAANDIIVRSRRWRFGFAAVYALVGLAALGFNVLMLTYGDFS